MTLELSVPGFSNRVLTDLERRPAKVEKWLAGLPLLNTADTGYKLHASLASYNRTPLDAALRLDLLELYRPPIKQVSLELQKQYVGLPLPLPDRAKTVAEQNRQFHIELANGYKQVLLDSPEGLPGAKPPDNALPIQRAIRHLTDILTTGFVSYSPMVPPGTWKEIHALYAHAQRLGLTEVEVPDPLNVAGKGTVGSAYRHALLLDLADPYHLPARTVLKIDQYLEAYAHLAQLKTVNGRVEAQCQFLIDPAADRAGIVNTGEEAAAEGLLLLDTVELARVVHAHLMSLKTGLVPAETGLERELFLDGGEEMLHRLLQVWGVHPKRVFRRNARANIEVDLAIGLDAINYWLNGGRRVVQSAAFIGPMPQRTSISSVETEPEEVLDEEQKYAPWSVQDESAGGLSLRKIGLVSRRVSVGDLVATRFKGSEGWKVGVVRWVKSPNPSRVEIGTQWLAPSALPILVKAVSGEDDESDFLPALLLPAMPALKQPESLLTPRGVFRPKRILYFDDGYRLRRVAAKQLLEMSAAFERFQFLPA